jgi:cytochrome c peroxidase
MFQRLALFTILTLILFGLTTCKKENPYTEDFEILNTYLNLPPIPYNYSAPNLPGFYANQFIQIQDNTPADNPTTNWGATLGRVLFYDKQLSINHTIACASCHQQANGFTDTVQFSLGLNGQTTTRHSMALGNAKYYLNGRFFWDERAATLEEQVLQPIQDPIEMGMTLALLEERIQASEFYPILFKIAFQNGEINSGNIAKALAQFVRSLVSYESKFDAGRATVSDIYQDFPNFTAQENLGKTIFSTNSKINCFSCHNTEAFITDNPRNNGLYLMNSDIGVSIHTNNTLDVGKFKAPSLKNVALRSRFMHDGSLVSLDEVIAHYNSRIKINENLDSHLIDITTGNPIRMQLSPSEIEALKAFLHTLTDEKFVSAPKYSNPFR